MADVTWTTDRGVDVVELNGYRLSVYENRDGRAPRSRAFLWSGAPLDGSHLYLSGHSFDAEHARTDALDVVESLTVAVSEAA